MTRSRVGWTLLTLLLGCGMMPRLSVAQGPSTLSFTLGPGRLSRDLSRLGYPDAVEWGIAGQVSWVHGMSERYGLGIALDLDAWSGEGQRFVSFSPAARLDLTRNGRAFASLGPGLAIDLVREECLTLADVQGAQLRALAARVGCPSYDHTEYLVVAAGAGVVLPVSRRISVTMRGRFLRTLLAPAARHPTRYPLTGLNILAGIEVR